MRGHLSIILTIANHMFSRRHFERGIASAPFWKVRASFGLARLLLLGRASLCGVSYPAEKYVRLEVAILHKEAERWRWIARCEWELRPPFGPTGCCRSWLPPTQWKQHWSDFSYRSLSVKIDIVKLIYEWKPLIHMQVCPFLDSCNGILSKDERFIHFNQTLVKQGEANVRFIFPHMSAYEILVPPSKSS